MRHLLSATAALLLAAPAIFADNDRVIRTINSAWVWSGNGQTEVVDFPHSWNAHDTWDDEPGFWRGACSYERTISLSAEELSGKTVTLRFEGANQVTDVFINGKAAGHHEGGYSAFAFDITALLREGANSFRFVVDNSHNPDIAPLSADFTFYGGIYRDVELIFTDKVHISTTHYGAGGVYLLPTLSEEGNKVGARTFLSNDSKSDCKVELTHRVIAPDGSVAGSGRRSVTLAPKCANQPLKFDIPVGGVWVWDFASPVTYLVETELSIDGVICDRTTNAIGFRSFSFDPDQGFFLNGKHHKLMGTNRHQDFEDRGNALADNMHERDMLLLKETGANFLRISHYPQDPIVSQLCDRFGIASSVEIPIVNEITDSDAFTFNCVNNALEMVYQNYNNPSVIIWAYMNEVLMRIPFPKSQPELRQGHFDKVIALAKKIDDAIKEADPSRYTMIPAHGNPDLYIGSGLAAVPDIMGWNYYQGWYGGGWEKFDEAMDHIHTALPDKPLIVTEYGAGADPRIHSEAPVRFDFSCEYALQFHKHYIGVIKDRDYIAGSNVWNLNDFYAEPRIDAVPHVNNKGLVGLDRSKKDVYTLYCANLREEPFLEIGGRNEKVRGGAEGDIQTVYVFSNRKSVTLRLNGKRVGRMKTDTGMAEFKLALRDGKNILTARSGRLKDHLELEYRAVPANMNRFSSMNVMLGTSRRFYDAIEGTMWIPEQEYRPGSWGYVGGEPLRPKTGNGKLPASNLDIFGTINDPVYQTQRTGIESFRADVPDGTYYVYLYFAELSPRSGSNITLAYNLGNDILDEKAGERVFDVSINGTKVLDGYDPAREVGLQYADARKFTVGVRGGEGLTVDFKAVRGETALNAIRIYRCN
ncbi:MAG: beta-galactosidase [Bacteroidales bacterium]|nr:beta-galactosidase [Candidatus Cryptobacteroides aphodequi]